MMATGRAALMAGLALTLSSCGDPNELTEDRIADILSEKVRLNPCMEFLHPALLGAMGGVIVNGAEVHMRDFLQSNDPFPITIRVGGFDEVFSSRYQEFEAAGLLTSKVEGEPSTGFGGRVEHRSYDLTDLGRSMYQTVEQEGRSGSPAGKNALFCAGKGQVAEIVNFVTPAEGENATRVSFRWNTVDDKGNAISTLPDQPWAGISPGRGRSLPQLEGEDTAMLTLTNNGWEVLP